MSSIVSWRLERTLTLTDCHADSDNPLKDFQKNLNDLKSADLSLVPEDFTAESIVNLDNAVIATTLEITESDIIEELTYCLSQQTEVENRRTTIATKIKLRNHSDKAKKNTEDQKLNLPLLFWKMPPCTTIKKMKCIDF